MVLQHANKSKPINTQTYNRLIKEEKRENVAISDPLPREAADSDCRS